MKPPIIQIDDFSGGLTLNEKPSGGRNTFHIGNNLDFGSRPGFLAPGISWRAVQLGASDDTTTRFPWILHLTNDELLLGGEDARIYRLGADLNTISVARTSTQTGAIRGVAEYRDHYYYAQATTIGRYALVGGAWTDNWQMGLQDVLYHPMKVAPDKILYIGNGRFVSMFNADGPVWNATRLDLADNWQIRCLEDFGILHLAIGASFQRTAGKPLTAKVFLWDRLSMSWNDEIVVPEKEIKAMRFVAGFLWIWAGRSCNLYVVPEGSRTATRVHTFVKEDPTEHFEVFPGAVIEKNGVIYFGLSRVGASSRNNNPCGIYSFPHNPRDFRLNIPYTRHYINEGFRENYTGLGLFHGGEGIGGDVILSSYQNLAGNFQRLFRQRSLATDVSFYSDEAVYESFRYLAPFNKKIMVDRFGIATDPLPAGTTLSLFFRKDNETAWAPVFTNFTTTNSVERTWPKPMEASSIKMKLTMRGSATNSNRPFIKALFVTGSINEKAI